MTKIATDNPQKFYMTYPNTVAVICVTVEGKTYVMPAVWQVPLSRDPMLFGVLVSPKRHTYAKLCQADDYSLNYFSVADSQLVTHLGSSTGSEMDKGEHFELDFDPSATIQSPLLRRAYVSLECKKQSTQTFGDHVLFVAEVSKIWWDDAVIDNGCPLIGSVNPLLYMGNFTYTTIDTTKVQACKAYQS